MEPSDDSWTTLEFIRHLTSNITLFNSLNALDIHSSSDSSNNDKPAEIAIAGANDALDYFIPPLSDNTGALLDESTTALSTVSESVMKQESLGGPLTGQTPPVLVKAESATHDPDLLRHQSLTENHFPVDPSVNPCHQQEQQQFTTTITMPYSFDKSPIVASQQALVESLSKISTPIHYCHTHHTTNDTSTQATDSPRSLCINTNVHHLYGTTSSPSSSSFIDSSTMKMYHQPGAIDSGVCIESIPQCYCSLVQSLPSEHCYPQYPVPQYQRLCPNQCQHLYYPSGVLEVPSPHTHVSSSTYSPMQLQQRSSSPYFQSIELPSPMFTPGMTGTTDPTVFYSTVAPYHVERAPFYYPTSIHPFALDPNDIMQNQRPTTLQSDISLKSSLGAPSSERHTLSERLQGMGHKSQSVVRSDKRGRVPSTNRCKKKDGSLIYTTSIPSTSSSAIPSLFQDSASFCNQLYQSSFPLNSSLYTPSKKSRKSQRKDKKVTDCAHYRPRNAFFMFRGFFSKLHSSITAEAAAAADAAATAAAASTSSKPPSISNKTQTRVSVSCGNLWKSACFDSCSTKRCANCKMRSLFVRSSSYLKHRQGLIEDQIAFPQSDDNTKTTTYPEPVRSTTFLERSFGWKEFKGLYPVSDLFRWHRGFRQEKKKEMEEEKVEKRVDDGDDIGESVDSNKEGKDERLLDRDLEEMQRIWIENEAAYEKSFIEGATKRLALAAAPRVEGKITLEKTSK